MNYTDAYDHWIESNWVSYFPDLDWKWGKAELCAESSLDPNARSPVGALGLGQAMPDTWSEIKGDLNFPSYASPLDPQYAIQGFCYYLHKCWKVWTAPRTAIDRLHLAQAAYNCGNGNVEAAQRKAKGANDYVSISEFLPDETRAYVQRIGAIYLSLPNSILTAGVSNG